MEQKSNVQYRAEKEYKNSLKNSSFCCARLLKCDSALIRKSK